MNSPEATCSFINLPGVAPQYLAACLRRRDDKLGVLEFVLTDTGGLGPKRLTLAAKRIIENDFAILDYLKRANGRSVKIEFLMSESSVPRESLRPGFPLLLPLQITDKLYMFQRTGVAWLLRHDRAILADDMGLGKTAQVLGAIRRLIRVGKARSAVVVAPRTLISNWTAEAQTWAPELVVTTATGQHGAGENGEQVWTRGLRRSHVIVTNYEQIRDPPAALIESPPDILVADEAHRLRNADSQTHQGFRNINSRWLWALTGTPVERSSADLAVLLSLLYPRRFAADSETDPSVLRARVRPYILRRTKDDVLRDLPSVTYISEDVALHPNQQRAYVEAIRSYTASRYTTLLPLFNTLRSICDIDPDSRTSSKLDRIRELCHEVADSGEKAVVFSYLLPPLHELATRLQASESIGAALLTGSLDLDERRRVIRRFKNDPGCQVLLASMRVASEGLTLTEANHVLFVNRWWNPSANSQASDRVIRIGQHRPVTVYYFNAKDTVEDRLEELLEGKQLSFDQLVNALRTPGSGVGTDDLFAPRL